MEWPSEGCDIKTIENIWDKIVNALELEKERTSGQIVHTHLIRGKCSKGSHDWWKITGHRFQNDWSVLSMTEGGWT